MNTAMNTSLACDVITSLAGNVIIGAIVSAFSSKK